MAQESEALTYQLFTLKYTLSHVTLITIKLSNSHYFYTFAFIKIYHTSSNFVWYCPNMIKTSVSWQKLQLIFTLPQQIALTQDCGIGNTWITVVPFWNGQLVSYKNQLNFVLLI